MRSKVLGWGLIIVGLLVLYKAIGAAHELEFNSHASFSRVVLELVAAIIIVGAGVILRSYVKARLANGFTDTSEQKATKILGKVKMEKR